LAVTRALLWDIHTHVLQLASGFLVQHRTGEEVDIHVGVFGQKHHILPTDALHTSMLG
jgi:hypothetical protein